MSQLFFQRIDILLKEIGSDETDTAVDVESNSSWRDNGSRIIHIKTITRPEYQDHDQRAAVAEEQGLESVLLFPTLGCGVEEFEGLPIVRLNDAPMTGVGATLAKKPAGSAA